MSDILVIRFGSLGDLCLLGWALARRHDASAAVGSGPQTGRVVVATKPVYADLVAGIRGVDEVLVPDGTGAMAVVRLGRLLARRPFGTVIDAHNVLRGHLLLAAMGRRPDRRLAKDTAARLALLRGAAADPRLRRTMVDRFAELLIPGLPGDPATFCEPDPPLARPHQLGPDRSGAGEVLGIAPGAQWDTKRWPAGRFAELIETYLGERPGPVRIFLGPREQGWFSDSPLGALAGHPRVQTVQGRSLTEVADLLAACAVVVTNDSGLLHLAEAVGTPVAALFGPTVREFGYFPRLQRSRVIERPLECRPCSRNGKRPCHRGDLACLAPITAGEVWSAVTGILDGTGNRTGGPA